MTGELPKGYLSPSQINMYLRCPAQYYFRYELDMKIPPRSALTKGISVHTGIEYNYAQKIETKTDVKTDEVKEVVSADFESRKDDTDWEAGEDPGEVKDRAIGLAELYHKDMAPTIQPLYVEQKIEVTIDLYDIILLGYIDLIDDMNWIRDSKTTARTPNANVAEKSLQLSAYYYAYRKLTGETPAGVKLDYMVDLKKPKLLTIEGQRDDRQLERFTSTVGAVAGAIKNMAYYPNENNFMCSPKHCGYWDICHKTF